MVIFFKKGNRKDIKNYRQICLLSNMYKLLTKIITTRLEKKLDENQPREQAGFRSKYSTTDHIHAINQLKEKCREYNILLCVAFVDYEKAFDSVQTQAILTSLQEQAGLEIRVDRWPESTKNPVGPPNPVRQWSGGLPKLCQRTLHLLAFFITFAVAVTAVAVTATMFFVFNIDLKHRYLFVFRRIWQLHFEHFFEVYAE